MKVLLIEDDPGDAECLLDLLSEADYQKIEVQWDKNLVSALERISQGGVDLVILDLGLPGTIGLNTFKELHAEAADLPIIVLTGLEDEELALTAVRNGAQDYLIKRKLDPMFLIKSMTYAIERHQLLLEVKKRHEQLAQMAHYDNLTGLPNRALFRDRLKQLIALTKRRHGKFGLFYLDLDGFKQVNDTHGHEIGDRLLQEVASRLMGCVRESDTVARLGGDEFAIIFAGLDSRGDAELLARKVLDLVLNPFLFGSIECRIGASIGITFFPNDAKEADHLVGCADGAMYDAKQSGKACYRFHAE
jgi:diguanylate cyclase (GGDEF)-like protein